MLFHVISQSSRGSGDPEWGPWDFPFGLFFPGSLFVLIDFLFYNIVSYKWYLGRAR